jgi:hypothetical protein
MIMGKWLKLLRESEKAPADRTDKTDKTAPAKVSSVLSVRANGVSRIFTPDKATGSGSFVSSPAKPFQDFRGFDNRSNWDDEDWQVALDERAAILEFDQGMPREEAETLARDQIEAERKRWLQ